MIHALLALALAAQDAPPAAAEAPPASAVLAAPDKAKAAPDPDAPICRREPVLGSRTAFNRTCHTRAQWEEMSRLGRDTTENIQRQPHWEKNN